MSARGLFTAATFAVSLAALIARTVALALADLDRGLRSIHCDTVPDVVPLWLEEEVDL